MIRSAATQSPWIVPFTSNPAARLRLLCFPYAGGGASVYSGWSRFLPSEVEVCGVQLPGREGRLCEPPITRWDDAVERLIEAVAWLPRPIAFFGHSLGAVLAFELARRLRKGPHDGLVHLFVSGRIAPHLPLEHPPTYNLPEEQFVRELRRLTGTPEEVLRSPEILEIFVPILRADFGLSETYAYRDDEPLQIPMSAYGGMKDERVRPAALEEWRAHTTSAFRCVLFAGGHFFLNEQRPAVLQELDRELRDVLVVLKTRDALQR